MATQWIELEKTSNKVTEFSETPSDEKYPSEKLVKNTMDKLEEDIAEGNLVVAQATNASYATNAEHSTNADNAGSANNATNINGLEIKRDDNGVLKIGDYIIPQKKLICEFDHSEGITEYIFDRNLGTTTLEIWFGENENHSPQRCILRITNNYAVTWAFYAFNDSTVLGSDVTTGNITTAYFQVTASSGTSDLSKLRMHSCKHALDTGIESESDHLHVLKIYEIIE